MIRPSLVPGGIPVPPPGQRNGFLRPSCFRLFSTSFISKQDCWQQYCWQMRLSSTRNGPSSFWRRGRDSNPRSAQTDNGFQDRRIRPLCHLSLRGIVEAMLCRRKLCSHVAPSSTRSCPSHPRPALLPPPLSPPDPSPNFHAVPINGRSPTPRSSSQRVA